jgi:hypothetical protein
MTSWLRPGAAMTVVATPFLAAFVALLAGCGSGASPDVSGAGSTLQSSGHDQNPYGIAYPAPPQDRYGHTARSGATAGSIIQNFKFQGFVDGIVPPSGRPGVVSLADFYDPCGKAYKIIRLSAAALWCGACGQETDAYVAAKADLAAKGVVVLQFLFEGPAMGAPATPSMLAGWIGEHGSNFTEMLDPELSDPDLGGFFQENAIPWNTDIDARTMEILTSTEGFGGSVDADLATALSDVASPPRYSVDAKCP